MFEFNSLSPGDTAEQHQSELTKPKAAGSIHGAGRPNDITAPGCQLHCEPDHGQPEGLFARIQKRNVGCYPNAEDTQLQLEPDRLSPGLAILPNVSTAPWQYDSAAAPLFTDLKVGSQPTSLAEHADGQRDDQPIDVLAMADVFDENDAARVLHNATNILAIGAYKIRRCDNLRQLVDRVIAVSHKTGHKIQKLDIDSHGNPGTLYFPLQTANLSDPQVLSELARLRPYLNQGASIVLNACKVAAGEPASGKLQQLADATGARVTADRWSQPAVYKFGFSFGPAVTVEPHQDRPYSSSSKGAGLTDRPSSDRSLGLSERLRYYADYLRPRRETAMERVGLSVGTLQFAREVAGSQSMRLTALALTASFACDWLLSSEAYAEYHARDRNGNGITRPGRGAPPLRCQLHPS